MIRICAGFEQDLRRTRAGIEQDLKNILTGMDEGGLDQNDI